MSDERLRDLERLVATGDETAKAKLRIEQVRLGVMRIAFPPRKKVRASEKAGIGFRGWCPACETWSLVRMRQKDRTMRGRHGHRAGRDVSGTKRARPTRICVHAIRHRHGRENTNLSGGGLSFCPGPAKGQPCRPPLHVLEAKLAELGVEFSWLPEAEWLRHRIAQERKRLGPGLHEGFARVECPHPSSRLGYTDGTRRRVRCKDCEAVLDATSGREIQ